MPPEKIHHIRGRALRSLAYPARMELLEALMSEQPATVEDLGRYLDREPKSLYHHLRPLVADGLVVEAGERPTTKRPATLYRLPADRLELDPEDRSKAAREARLGMARSVLRRVIGLHQEALENRETVLGGRRRMLSLGHRIVRLTPSGLQRVNAKLRELFELCGEVHDERGQPFALTLSLAPATRSSTRST